MTAIDRSKSGTDREGGERARTHETSGSQTLVYFELDIKFLENTPEADGIVFCTTGDGCGTSCPSACTTSLF